ncbi:MAG TPA: hypothetical protein VGL91_23585 [Acidobacteriota bacterium]|jgi:septal ring factor EnvC (AmiA/AmiB activator)
MEPLNNSPQDVKRPLFAYSYPKEDQKERKWEIPNVSRSTLGLVAGVLVTFVLAMVTFFSYRSGDRELQAQIAANEDQTAGLTRQLQDLEKENATLRDQLNSSHSRLGAELSRTRTLYSTVRRDQERSQEELKRAIETKADASQVSSQVNSLKSEQDTVKTNVSGLNNEVSTVKTDLSSVREQTSKNSAQLQQHAQEIATNRESINSTSKDFSTFKSSFDREVLSFELPKSGKPVQVGDVSLRLSKTSERSSEFSLQIILGGKVLSKKNRALNEPIYFYGEGYRRPFELVITRVDKNSVTGTLAVPRKT